MRLYAGYEQEINFRGTGKRQRGAVVD
jgi:hypothetical protein